MPWDVMGAGWALLGPAPCLCPRGSEGTELRKTEHLPAPHQPVQLYGVGWCWQQTPLVLAAHGDCTAPSTMTVRLPAPQPYGSQHHDCTAPSTSGGGAPLLRCHQQHQQTPHGQDATPKLPSSANPPETGISASPLGSHGSAGRSELVRGPIGTYRAAVAPQLPQHQQSRASPFSPL